MKTINTLFTAAVLSTLSFASFAAVEVQSAPAGQQELTAIGVTGSTNLASVEKKSG